MPTSYSLARSRQDDQEGVAAVMRDGRRQREHAPSRTATSAAPSSSASWWPSTARAEALDLLLQRRRQALHQAGNRLEEAECRPPSAPARRACRLPRRPWPSPTGPRPWAGEIRRRGRRRRCSPSAPSRPRRSWPTDTCPRACGRCRSTGWPSAAARATSGRPGPCRDCPGPCVWALIRPGCISRFRASIDGGAVGRGEAGPADLGDRVALDQDVGGHRLAPGDVEELAAANDGVGNLFGPWLPQSRKLGCHSSDKNQRRLSRQRPLSYPR